MSNGNIVAKFINIGTATNASSTGDLAISNNLYVSNDISLNGNLKMSNGNIVAKFINIGTATNASSTGDLAISNNLYVSNDVSLNGNLKMSNGNIVAKFINIGTATNASSTGDLAISNNLYVSNDVSLNGRLYVSLKSIFDKDVSMNSSFNAKSGNINGNAIATTPSIDRIDGSLNTIIGNIRTINTNISRIDGSINTIIGSINTINTNISGVIKKGNTANDGDLTMNGNITASSFNATSDKRIKTNIESIDTSNALDIIRQIEPKSYDYIDTNNKTQTKSIGFIAQDIKNLIENSVSESTRFIPNIYDDATIIDNKTIKLSSVLLPSDIQIPAKVKIYIDKNKTKEIICNIEKIVDTNIIILSDSIDEEIQSNIFIYGTEVHDFCSLNYNNIFTLMTASVKEIDKKQQEIENIITNQQNQIDDISKKLSIIGIE